MTYGQLVSPQAEALASLIDGRVVHDLGCGDQVLSELLLYLGAATVIAVDWQPTGRPGSKVRTVRAKFAEYVASEPTIDVAFVSWPYNQVDLSLFELVTRAKMVAYLGKCTDGALCGWPGLFRYFLSRELAAHVPHPANTLLIYGGPLKTPRTGELEERAGLDWQTVRSYGGIP